MVRAPFGPPVMPLPPLIDGNIGLGLGKIVYNSQSKVGDGYNRPLLYWQGKRYLPFRLVYNSLFIAGLQVDQNLGLASQERH